MAQVKIYGLQAQLNPIKRQLSDVIHTCVVDALQFPKDKRAHRFFPLDAADFFYPAGRTTSYTIIEITMMTGRTVETKKRLIRLLFDRIEATLGIAQHDLEICITESPPIIGASAGCTGMRYSWIIKSMCSRKVIEEEAR